MTRLTHQERSVGKKRPTCQDQLVFCLLSLGIFLLVMALGLRAGQMVELVLIVVAAFAVVSTNLLFAYSTWDETGVQEKEQEPDSQQRKD